MRRMFHAKPQGVTAALAAALLLSGCVSFGGKPPERLLSLDAAHKVPSGAARVAGGGRTLIVTEPEAPKMLDTVRVAVKTRAEADWARLSGLARR